MPETVAPAADFTIRLRLGRHEPVPIPDTSNVSQQVYINPEELITVEASGSGTVEISDQDGTALGWPSGEHASEVHLRGTAVKPGPGDVNVRLRQGSVTVATAVLHATAGEKPVPPFASPAIHTGIEAAELADVACLEITRERRPSGELVFGYAVRLVPGETQRFVSTPVVDPDGFVLDRYAGSRPSSRIRTSWPLGG